MVRLFPLPCCSGRALRYLVSPLLTSSFPPSFASHSFSHATEDTMRPFRGPDSPSWGATAPAGIVNKVKGSAVRCPGMTPVDGFYQPADQVKW